MQRKTKIAIASTAAGAVLGIGLYSVTSSAVAGFKRFGGHMGPMGGQVAYKIFDEFDANKDGSLTRAEIEAYRKKNFTKYDANGDGKLELDEFQGLWTEHTRQPMIRAFQFLDSDASGGVSGDETAQPMNRMMTWMDRNNDGKITKDEMRGHRRGWGHRGKHRWGYKYDDDDDDDDRKK